jgi:Protein of unknown function (DUF3237)
MSDITTPTLIPVFSLDVKVAPPIDLGESPAGHRRVIPILGGEIKGERLNGRVLPGANDYQIIRRDNVLELEARYIIETDDGAQIFVINNGIRVADADVLARQNRGEMVDPKLVYFRAVPRFETADPRYQWMMKRLFVCVGTRFPAHVQISFFEVS